MSLTYTSSVTPELYIATIMASIIFSFSCILLTKQIKEILLLIKENKELVSIIKTILQVFPEGVVIRSLDPESKKTLLKFSNSVFQNKFCDDELLENQNPEMMSVTILTPDQENGEVDEQTMMLSKFLDMQEASIINYEEDELSVDEQIIEIKQRVQNLGGYNHLFQSDSENVQCFKVKSIKVNWEMNKDSYLHVFVNTTEVRRLEKARAVNKCQQLMFASISHEFRTPLNAFMNSLNIVELIVEEVKTKLKDIFRAQDLISQYYPKLEKMI